MTDVLLHDYVTELRADVTAQKYSDAFALGQHILHYYPKHLETYVVLAQACLDTNDLAGATDLLRRVLSADPENVIALAGMALINETQDKYDEALWYLERAYEIQPTNDELRRELVRVRELYYGTSSERLELTAGALARVYARQGQYASAINEFRRLLRTETKRYDARVGLAETLYRAGRTDEAAQLAQNIMSDAPYSLKPNLILGVLWAENAVPEGQQYLSRAQAVDPEHRVARELIGAQFANAQPPRLPSRDAQVMSSELDDQVIGLAHGDTLANDEQITRQSALLREIERASEMEQAEDLTLIGDPEAAQETDLSAIAFAAATALAIPEAAAKEQAIAEAQQADSESAALEETRAAPDSTLAEIAAAEQAHTAATAPPPPAEKPTSQFAQRVSRSKNDAVPTDAIAAAAAALATSIAVDKMSQPAPARRTHPALPKVRPVIRGASDKLPVWLRLGSTPSAASASFEVPLSTTAEKTEPLAPSGSNVTAKLDDRPEWLVQAQAASQDTTTPASDATLPDWLKTAGAVEIAQASAGKIAPAETLDTVETPGEQIAEQQTSVAALPDWLHDQEPPDAQNIAAAAAAPVVEGWTNEPEKPQAPVYKTAIENEPPTVRAEPQNANAELPDWLQESAPAAGAAETAPGIPAAQTGIEPAPVQEKPLDALALIGNARERRANGDLKSAMDMYERAMHRRPNHLDEIINDLQEIVSVPTTPSSANRLLGEAYAMAGRFKESLEQYRIAMGK